MTETHRREPPALSRGNAILAAISALLAVSGPLWLGPWLSRGRKTGAALAAELEGAGAGRRLLAGGADLLLAYLLMLIPVIGWALACAFLLFRDALFSGRSPGRRLAGVALVVETEGGHASFGRDAWLSFRRNAPLGLPGLQLVLVPVEAILLLLGRARIGERLAPQTRAVRRRG